MHSLILAVLVTCPPGGDPGYQPAPTAFAVSPDAGPPSGGPSHHGHHRLFGWLRGHRDTGKCACAGKGRAHDDGVSMTPAPAPAAGAAPVVEFLPPETIEALPAEPAAAVVAPPAPAGPAPRLVPVPQSARASAEPPLAAPADGAARQMPRGPAVMTEAQPPGD